MADVSDTDLRYLQTWVGRRETVVDDVRASPMAALAATLDREDPPPQSGDPLPILWHWLFCLSLHRSSALAADGHAELGGFLPPVPLPRRMYAGGSVDLREPLRVGDSVSRVSRIAEVTHKVGRSGELVFVTVEHEFRVADRVAVAEQQHLVYRGAPAEGGERAEPRVAAGEPAAWTRELLPDEVLLFRYSALTFNGYRIHYDREFAASQGYRGLVVHGPLLATLLADLVRRQRPDAIVSRFSFRAVRALVDGAPFQLCGSPAADGTAVKLWVQNREGVLAMEATAALK
jgi:3-methylfumaryl-CoA hydratase